MTRLEFEGDVVCGNTYRCDYHYAEDAQPYAGLEGAVHIDNVDVVDAIAEAAWSRNVRVLLNGDELANGVAVTALGWGYSEMTPVESDEVTIGECDLLERLTALEDTHVTLIVEDVPNGAPALPDDAYECAHCRGVIKRVAGWVTMQVPLTAYHDTTNADLVKSAVPVCLPCWEQIRPTPLIKLVTYEDYARAGYQCMSAFPPEEPCQQNVKGFDGAGGFDGLMAFLDARQCSDGTDVLATVRAYIDTHGHGFKSWSVNSLAGLPKEFYRNNRFDEVFHTDDPERGDSK